MKSTLTKAIALTACAVLMLPTISQSFQFENYKLIQIAIASLILSVGVFNVITWKRIEFTAYYLSDLNPFSHVQERVILLEIDMNFVLNNVESWCSKHGCQLIGQNTSNQELLFHLPRNGWRMGENIFIKIKGEKNITSILLFQITLGPISNHPEESILIDKIGFELKSSLTV